MTDEERLGAIEKILETQEQLFASLMTGYAEVVALVEVLAGTVIGTKTEDEQTEFLKEFDKVRTALLSHMQGAVDGNLDREGPDLVAAVGRLVAQRKAARPEQ